MNLMDLMMVPAMRYKLKPELDEPETIDLMMTPFDDTPFFNSMNLMDLMMVSGSSSSGLSL